MIILYNYDMTLLKSLISIVNDNVLFEINEVLKIVFRIYELVLEAENVKFVPRSITLLIY